jgi:SSS family solute:Na+ symporter
VAGRRAGRAAAAGKLAWLNTEFTLSAPFNLWMGIIGGTVMVLSTHGAEQLIVQRVLACSTVCRRPEGTRLQRRADLPALPGFPAGRRDALGVLPGRTLSKSPLPESRPGIKSNDFIFPIFMVTEVPHC